MTLIADINLKGQSVLIGDLMLSQKSSRIKSKRLLLPTGYVETKHAKMNGYIPVKLVQKIVILNDRCAICWSGSDKYISIIIESLRAHLENHADGASTLVEFLASMPSFMIGTVDIIGQVILPDGRLRSFSSPECEKFEVGDGVQITASGSGTAHLKNVIGRLFSEMEGLHQASALTVALCGAGMLVDIEAIHQQSTPMSYGGAYEICYYDGSKFVKLDEVVLSKMVFRIFESEYEYGIAQSHVCTRYEENDLLITSIIHDRNTHLLCTYARPPISQGQPPPYKHEPFLNGKHMGITISVMWKDIFLRDIICAFTGLNKDTTPIHYSVVNDDNEIEYAFRSGWLNDILAMSRALVLSRYPDTIFTPLKL